MSARAASHSPTNALSESSIKFVVLREAFAVAGTFTHFFRSVSYGLSHSGSFPSEGIPAASDPIITFSLRTSPISAYLLDLTHALVGNCNKIAFILLQIFRQAREASVRHRAKPPETKSLDEHRGFFCSITP